MQELYDLKEMLCKELKEYGTKDEMSAGSLDVVDKLTHAIKNLDKVIEGYESEDGEYSSRSYSDGMSYRYSRNDGSYRGGSYARGRYAPRDRMGRYSGRGYSRDGGYSNHGSLADELRELMEAVPDDQTRQEMQRLIQKMEQR